VANNQPPRKSTNKADAAKGRASVERAMALRDVMSHAVEADKESRKSSGPPKESGGSRVFMLVLSIGLAAFTVFAYSTRPEFIFGANPNNVTEVRRDANVRFTLYLLSRRVESYKKQQQKYPDDLLSVTKTPPKGVEYARLSNDVFELRAKDGANLLVFRSDEPADKFLGQVPKTLQGRDR
jgi:hypothetical protein